MNNGLLIKASEYQKAAKKKKKGKGEIVLIAILVNLLIGGTLFGLTWCIENNEGSRSPSALAANPDPVFYTQPAAIRTETNPVTQANTITVRGIVESVQRRNIYSMLGTKVDRIYVQVGVAVREGQVLGVLDTADFVNEVRIAEASLRMAEVNLAAARHNHETTRILYNARAVPRDTFRQSEFALQLAIAAREQAQAMLNAANTFLERSIIRSPINGTVTAVHARVGEAAMGRLFVVEDINNLRILTHFREYDIARLQKGKEVDITSYATGNTVYRGIISRINPAAIADTPIVEFEAEVLVTSPNTNLRIGTNARLNINY